MKVNQMVSFALRLRILQTAALTLFALSGCTLTEALWDKGFSTGYSGYEKIHSFGFTKADSKNLPPNRLVMLGERAVYVTEITPEHDLAKALRATDLHKQFGYRLHVQMESGIEGNFTATSDRQGNNLCLSYVLFNDSVADAKRNDPKKLEALGFKKEPYPANPNVTDYYVRCYDAVRGVRYRMKGMLPAEYRFKYPVEIYLEAPASQAGRTGAAVGSALLTPLAVIGDVILLPVTLPLLPYKGAKI